MRIVESSDLEKFLSEPWWTGVQGVLAIVGLVAIGFAVVDLVRHLNQDTPKAISFSIKRSRVVVNGTTDITVTARPMGPHVLYEPRWLVTGHLPELLPELPSSLDVRDDAVTISLDVAREDIATTSVGIAWVVPRRWSSHAAGSRMQIKDDGYYQVWRLYRWRWWPRQKPGRWVNLRNAGKRNPLYIE